MLPKSTNIPLSNNAVEELGGGVTSQTPRKVSILAIFLHLVLMTGLEGGGWVGRCERTKPMQVITATTLVPPNTCHFPPGGNDDRLVVGWTEGRLQSIVYPNKTSASYHRAAPLVPSILTIFLVSWAGGWTLEGRLQAHEDPAAPW